MVIKLLLQERPSDLVVGSLVAAPFPHDASYYRARVVAVNDKEAELYYVDFGDPGTMPLDKIYKLDGDFLSLPHQAFECYLANVKPAGK